MYLEPCNEIQLRQIYEELGVTETSLKRDVEYLMEWLEKQPHLPNARDEDYLANVLLRCKNSLEKAKQKLDLRFTVSSLIPEAFTDSYLHDGRYKNMLDAVLPYMPLPKLTKDGDRVFVFHVFDADKANGITVDDIFSASAIRSDIDLKADICRKFILIFDAANLSVTFATTLLQAGRRISSISTTTETMRLRKVIIINQNPKLQFLLDIWKKFWSKKIMDKFEVWQKGSKDLVDILPKDVLPSNYGGDEKSLEELKELYYNYTIDFRDWLSSMWELKADLSKRPHDDLHKKISTFGTEGSFRELSVD